MLPSQSPQNQWSSHTSSPLWTHHYVILCYIIQVKTESAIRELWKIFFVLNQTQRNKPESNKAKKATLTAVMCKEVFSIQWDFVLWVITDKSLSEYCIEITYFYPFSLNTGLILSRFSDCHFPQKSWRTVNIQAPVSWGRTHPFPLRNVSAKTVVKHLIRCQWRICSCAFSVSIQLHKGSEVLFWNFFLESKLIL